MRAEEIWFSEKPGPSFIRTLLTPLSWLYAGGWQAYLALYGTGLKRAKEPHCPVLCIGNLTVGGSGKSPLTLHLYDLIREMGREVVVSASGYGSRRSESATVAPEGDLDALEWGDEPAMLRWLRPEMALVVGRGRVHAAELAHQTLLDSVLLLDDGFQHLPLKKHLTLLLDPLDPPNKRCLPAGPYREPRSNRRRADLVLPGKFTVQEGLITFLDSRERSSSPPQKPEGPIQVLCALGRPDKFVAALEGQDFHVAEARLLPDHDPLDAGNLWDGLNSSLPVVVTAKDWVKLRRRNDLNRWQIWVAMRDVRVEPAAEFREFLHVTLS